MQETNAQTAKSTGSLKIVVASFWILSLVLVGFLSFGYGKGSVTSPSQSDEKVLSAQSNQTLQDSVTSPDGDTHTPPANAVVATVAVTEGPKQNETSTCAKTGLAQKWEYLTPYVIKQNDTLQIIATEQLKDSSRVNELLQLNGVGPLVVGATLYLPPSSITKSSGKLQQIYGKLVDKNETSWHLSFSNDKNGQGVLIPAFLFESVANKNSFQVGDCISVFLDDGYKVYTVTQQ